MLTGSQVIVLAVPVFLGLIVLEFAWGRARGRNTYALGDAVNSLGLGVLSQISAVFTGLLRLGLYVLAFEHLALWRNDAFWTAWYGWLLALLFYDLCYYWLHRLGHEVAVLWAAHVVHHQSQHYNLSTALRQTSSGALLGWVFYLPMALAGVPPLVFAVVALVDLLYQFWVHTEHVPRLGWFDRWFCSPSNHRVHHAVNDRYLDRNYGGILIVWDRLFGSFEDEDPLEKPIYGTRAPLNSWDPLWANLEVYWALAQDSWRARRWGDKLRVWFKPPGWRPADVAARWPRPAFDISAVQHYDPPAGRSVQALVAAEFVLLLGATSLFLWHAEALPVLDGVLWFGVLTLVLWTLGALLQGRISVWLALALQAAALATVTAALGLEPWHRAAKPAVMVFAMVLVAACARQERAERGFYWNLGAALFLSLLGDVALMVPGGFVPGLAAFLLAHLAYIALFKRGVPWFPSRGALVLTLAVGVGMYAFLWQGGLPVGLRAPVAAYVVAISLMTAQALGRARALGTRGAWLVAAGACCFMLSDALLATNRFVQPLPLAALWVLASYYIAQLLIAACARPVWAKP